MNFDKNVFECEIVDIAYGGDGVAKRDGKTVFIPATINGEKILARTTEIRKHFEKARCESIEVHSPHRIKPKCPLALEPGMDPNKQSCCGCSYQHISYHHEVEIKRNQLLNLIRRIAKISEIPEVEIIPSPSELNYRNKISFRIGRKKSGEKFLAYTARDNKTLIEIRNCPIAVAPLNEHLAEIISQPDSLSSTDENSLLFLRFSQSNGVLEWIIPGRVPNVNILEKTGVGDILVPAGSFFQVSVFADEILFSKVSQITKELTPKKVIDLYCGSGIFTFSSVLDSVKFAIGVESDPNAIECARLNAEKLGLKSKTSFLCAQSEKVVRKLLKEHTCSELLVIVDPPRAGLHENVINALCEIPAKNFLYISCGPDTLARDSKKLFESAYKLERLVLCDIFPRTSHFETIALFTKR